ncbi:MAG TPA: hybrid sensor histidine kinase/response regulator, partial [Polyangiales bacterium]|nr:hybrid sensor histidine kinase/response regulator [Polyangiales bacterium]
DVDTFDRAQLAGADDFLTKPVRPTELLARVQAVLKLRRMNADLRGLYDVVRHQRDDLMRLQLQKERLSAFVVHDLKNPVTAMDLMAQVLASDRDAPERVRTTALQIRSEARALMRLILNLLDISKSEEGKLEPRRVRLELAQLVKDAFESVEAKATLHEVTLEKQLKLTYVTADPDLLRRVLENLLDNAIRHTPSGGSVRLTAETVGDGLVLCVEDSGKGVPPSMREKIFDPFVQDEAGRHPTRSGRGLGLSFCRLAVEAHAGSICVEEASPGARFVVRLPSA